MTNYPEWVTKYKEKGIYVKHSKDKYYLYRGHSERIAGTKKVRFICDEYLGRITEIEGLIPSKDKVHDVVVSYEYGLSATVFVSCENIYKGLRKSFVKYGNFIMIASILTYIYEDYSLELFQFSWLSLRFTDLVFPDTVTDAQKLGIERGNRMITDTMKRIFGDDLQKTNAYLSLMRLIAINGTIYPSKIPPQAASLIDKYNIKMAGITLGDGTPSKTDDIWISFYH